MYGNTIINPILTAKLKFRAERVVTISAESARINVLRMIQSAAGANSAEDDEDVLSALVFWVLVDFKMRFRTWAEETAERTSMLQTPTLAASFNRGVFFLRMASIQKNTRIES